MKCCLDRTAASHATVLWLEPLVRDLSLWACGVWQSQYPLGRRASASVAMLTDTLRQLPNLSIKVGTLLGRSLPQSHPLASKGN